MTEADDLRSPACTSPTPEECDEGIGFGRQEYVTIRLADYPTASKEA